MPKIQYVFFVVLFLAVLVLMFLVLKPFLSALFIAMAFAVIFSPLHERLLTAFNKRESLAALCTVLLIVVIILVPLIILGGLLFNEARGLYLDQGVAQNGVIQKVTNTAEQYIQGLAPQVTLDVESYIQTGLQWIVSHLNNFFSGFFTVLLFLFIMVIALFYFIRDGKVLKSKIIELSPLSDAYDERILKTLHTAINSVIKGSLIISVIQAILAGFGLFIFGIPNAVLWGALTLIAALIPGIGTALILGPAIIYLFYIGNAVQGVGLLIWGSLAVGLIDNVLAPILIKRGIKIHPFLILLSVLGGIAFFGPIGFLAGPVFLSFFFALLELYPIIVKNSV